MIEPETSIRSRYFLILTTSAVLASLLLGFRLELKPITPGLDPSWIWAINYAAFEGLRWGKEFIFTYGPYGYIFQTMDLGNHAIQRIVFELLLVVGSGLAVAVYLHSLLFLRKSSRMMLMLVLIYIVSIQIEEYRWWVLFLLVLLAGIHLSNRAAHITFAIAGILSGFYLLLKFSLGFGSLLTLIILCVACLLVWSPVLVAYRFSIAIAAATISFITGWIASGGGIWDIGAYVTTGLELSSGYSAAMSSDLPHLYVALIGYILFCLLLLIWTVILRERSNWLLLALLSFPLFVAWKHAIVRHMIMLILFGLFVITILFIHSVTDLKWRSAIPFVGLSLFLVTTVLLSTPHYWPKLKNIMIRPISDVDNELSKLINFALYRKFINQVSEKTQRKVVLPDSMRSVIGKSSIDVYPWDISYVPANGLNWINRPLPASYSTYTPALDKLNAAFFNSNSIRPEYLLWHHDRIRGGMYSIDRRHIFFDEPQTLLTILSNYKLIMEGPDVSLLRISQYGRFTSARQIGTIKVPWNIWVAVPQVSGVLTASASSKPTLTMRLIRLIYRVNPIYLSLQFSSGEQLTYRLVSDNMASGLWINPFPVTVEEFRSLIKGGPARQVVAVRFNGGLAGKMSSDITISWQQFNLLEPH